MKLNCDLGESFGSWKMGNDESIMPYIDQANIACGFHASDPLTMQKTITLAVKHNVTIGAHPGYPDIIGFGRRSMTIDSQELKAIVQYQVGALSALCQAQGTNVQYVKPHGALYNDMMKNDDIFITLCQSLDELGELNTSLPLVIQATYDNERYRALAENYGITIQFEAFADRHYQDNGLLVPRSQGNALITDETQLIKRIELLKDEDYLLSENNKKLPMKVDTLCIHGDTHGAAVLAKSIARTLSIK